MKSIFNGNRYANVTSTLALVVALGGTGAYAANTIASKDIRNGQVKNADLARDAVTGSKVKKGTLRGDDFKAGELPKGDKGDPGAAGGAGAQGPVGPTLPAALPGGQTLRGAYAFSGYYGGSPQPYTIYDKGPADGQISFQIPLAAGSEPTVVISQKGAGAVLHCPGSITNPQADPGYLCVYESSIANNDGLGSFNPVNGIHDIATRFGVGLFILGPAGPAAEHRTSKGTWAVTAP